MLLDVERSLRAPCSDVWASLISSFYLRNLRWRKWRKLKLWGRTTIKLDTNIVPQGLIAVAMFARRFFRFIACTLNRDSLAMAKDSPRSMYLRCWPTTETCFAL